MTTGRGHRYALPPGHRLGEYCIDRYLGSGGFGITYLATDENLNLQVAIKEYLPSDLAMRDADNSVVVKTAQDEDDFEWGRERFLDEARSLARFNHPNIVRVQRFFEAHGTSYIVMDYVEGEPLSDLLERKGTLTEAETYQLVLPLANGLAAVHEVGLLHRDIKPGNIIIRDDGTPVLIDFGSARQAMGSKSRSMTSVVTPGYAPLEQYATNSRQGPATDIYAFGAVLYRCVTGKAPNEATERAIKDELTPTTQAAVDNYSTDLLAAIDTTLALRVEDRPQSMTEFLSNLDEVAVPGATARASHTPRSSKAGMGEDSARVITKQGKQRRPSHRYLLATFVVSVAVLGTLLILAIFPRFQVGQAILVVNTEPEEAEVLIAPFSHVSSNGSASGIERLRHLYVRSEPEPPEWKPLGKTPLERHDIRPGTYQIVLRHPYYQPAHLTNQVIGEDRVLRVEKVLVPGFGAVTVTTRPRNAWVEHDGRLLAEGTPVTLEGLPAGELELTLGAEGHRTTKVRVAIPHNGVASVNRDLQRVPHGTLTLQLSPPEAMVTLPDIESVYQPGMRLLEGPLLVVVQHPGYKQATKSVIVSGDTYVQIELEALPPTPGIASTGAPKHLPDPIPNATSSSKPQDPAKDSVSADNQVVAKATSDFDKAHEQAFTRGSHQDVVLWVQGTPTNIIRLPGSETWFYGASSVEISAATERVTGWSNLGGNLKVQMLPGSSITKAPAFTRGSHQDDVLRLQGTPTNIIRLPGSETWFYGASSVEISAATERVTGWSNLGGNLKVQMLPGSSITKAPAFTRGSHQDDVLRLQGTPTNIIRLPGSETWFYGASSVEISAATERVTGWSNLGGNLKVQMLPGSSITKAPAFTRGSHQDDVLRLQGTPTNIIRLPGSETWFYGASSVEISAATERVTGWSNLGGNLKVHLVPGL